MPSTDKQLLSRTAVRCTDTHKTASQLQRFLAVSHRYSLAAATQPVRFQRHNLQIFRRNNRLAIQVHSCNSFHAGRHQPKKLLSCADAEPPQLRSRKAFGRMPGQTATHPHTVVTYPSTIEKRFSGCHPCSNPAAQLTQPQSYPPTLLPSRTVF
jgi:hypothetical protein